MNKVANIPGWSKVELQDITYRITKGTTPTSVGFKFTNTGILFVKVESLSSKRIVHELCAFISSEADEALARSRLKEGDVLFSIAGTLGRIAIVNSDDLPANTNQAVAIIRLIPPIRSTYIAHVLSSHLLEASVQKQRRGVGLQNLNLRQVSELEIPLPPLNEQKRIVTKIEALQTRSTAVKEELKAIKPLLNQFRQSVLASAFRGDLTKDWREQNSDVEPAEVLLERIKVERRQRWEETELEKMKAKGKVPKDDKWKKKYKEPEPIDTEGLPELPDGWCWTKLEQCLLSLRNGLSKKPADKPPGTPILRISAVRAMKVDMDDIRYYPLNSKDNINDFLLEPNDLMFTRYNGSRAFVGVCGLVPNMNNQLLYPDKLIRVRLVNKSLSIPKYLEFACNCGFSRLYIESKIKTSAGQQGIAGGDLKLTPISLPPLKEQKEIVRRIESLFKLADSIEQQYQQAEVDLATLNQSILAKAFRGELVPQDPNDEPASVLLERIRAERDRAKAAAKKSKGKKKSSSKKQDKQLGIPGM